MRIPKIEKRPNLKSFWVILEPITIERDVVEIRQILNAVDGVILVWVSHRKLDRGRVVVGVPLVDDIRADLDDLVIAVGVVGLVEGVYISRVAAEGSGEDGGLEDFKKIRFAALGGDFRKLFDSEGGIVDVTEGAIVLFL